jgi:hypothetical protein
MTEASIVLVLSLVIGGLAYRRLRGFILAARDSADDAGRLAAKADRRAGEAHKRLTQISKRLGADT